jgi:SAM-dependent methyltransferase
LTGSVSFDRAAGYYDQTRSLPDDLMDVLVPRLVAEIPRDRPCLEIGAGTGRIALPLMDRGVDLVGVDISAEMLHRLLAKRANANVALADATRLPFGDRTFGSAVASHVLHLIPDWKTAVDELTRVVVPGGVLLASKGAERTTEWEVGVRRHFCVEAGDPPWPPGIGSMDELDGEMSRRGAVVGRVEDVVNEGSYSISALLATLEQGIFAACWSLDEETRRRSAAATREWASHEYGDLDEPRATSHSSEWRAYRFPG